MTLRNVKHSLFLHDSEEEFRAEGNHDSGRHREKDRAYAWLCEGERDQELHASLDVSPIPAPLGREPVGNSLHCSSGQSMPQLLYARVSPRAAPIGVPLGPPGAEDPGTPSFEMAFSLRAG